MNAVLVLVTCLGISFPWSSSKKGDKAKPAPPPSALDKYVTEALSRNSSAQGNSADPGSLFSPTSRLLDVTHDIKAAQRDDIGPLANLLTLGGTTTLDGEGTTSRVTTLTTTLTARVTHVLPNGYLVVEGTKLLGINSEHQVITVRGVVRPDDLNSANSVPSDLLGQLEVQVDGKGVVNDATHRPNFLYRLLLGILPF